MITRIKRNIVIPFLLIAIAFACQPESDEPIPIIPFADITINLSLPENYALQISGGYKYVKGGVRGILVHHHSSNTYHAFERNCTYQPNDVCATIEMEPSNLRILEPCCSSIFSLDGDPIQGVARLPLRQYRVVNQNGVLTISDQIIN